MRTQIANNGAISIILHHLRRSTEPGVRRAAAGLLVNLSHNHKMNQNRIMAEEGNAVLLLQFQMDPEDILMTNAFYALANLAHQEVNQNAIGYSNIIPLLVEKVINSSSPRVLHAAGTAFRSIMLTRSDGRGEHGAQQLSQQAEVLSSRHCKDDAPHHLRADSIRIRSQSIEHHMQGACLIHAAGRESTTRRAVGCHVHSCAILCARKGQ